MICKGFASVLLLAVQVLSLPVTNPTNKSDSKVMKCIVEVISDTLSKPNPLPISRECLETLKGDERIVSVLRHQNLLKELQEIAAQGASERTEQQEKNGGFEDELSEVLEKQNDRSVQRDRSNEIPAEEPTDSPAELEAGKGQQNKRDDSMEEEKNSLEAREPRIRNVDPEDNKENAEEFESNEIGETEEVHREDTLNNHISDDLTEDQESEQRHQEGEEDPTNESLELEEEKEHVSEKSQEESKEEVEETVQDRAEEEEEKEENGRGTSEEERPTSSIEDETEETQREDNNEDGRDFDKGEKPSEEEEKPRSGKEGRHRSEDDVMQEEDTSHPRESKSEEMEEEPSKEWEDSKRWNKMDELAKQLTTKKRAEENDNAEDPDRSMKMSFRSHKYDFHNPEETVRSSWKRHSKEESSEGAFPLVAVPEEKKDEEGSANRRTEDQELESLAAIEAELEKVAHKLHELRKG